MIFIVNEAHKIHKFQSISSPRLYPSNSQYRDFVSVQLCHKKRKEREKNYVHWSVRFIEE